MTSTEFKGAPRATLTIDLADLFAAGKLLDYDDDDNPVYASSFLDQIVSAAAQRIVERFSRDELHTVLRERTEALVQEKIAAALDRGGVVERDVFGNPKGPTKTMGEYLADKAAEQVGEWMRGTGGYSPSKFRDFLSREVDRAIAADLKGVVDKARAEIRARMDAAATKAIADAATAAVRGL